MKQLMKQLGYSLRQRFREMVLAQQEAYALTHCECRMRLKTDEERGKGYCSRCWVIVAREIDDIRRSNLLDSQG